MSSLQTKSQGRLTGRQTVLYARVGLALALLVVAYSSFRILGGVVELWQTQDAFSHGWAILCMVLYLLWLQRREILADQLEPFWLALLPIAGIGLLQSTGVLNLEMFLLPSLLMCIVILFVGPRASIKYAFPLLLLHAALPGWGQALPLLHKMTVLAVQQMLSLTGITAFFDGAVVNIPSGSFIIEDGCSGMNYFIVGTTIASIYAYLGPRSWRLAAISLCLGILLSVIANWVRVYGVILIGHFTDMQSPIVNNHGTFGWFIFAGAMILFYLVMARLFPDERFLKPKKADDPTSDLSGDGLSNSNLGDFGLATALVAVSLLIALQLGGLTNWLLASDNPLAALSLPQEASSTLQPNRWKPRVHGATDIKSTTIGSVSLDVARFDRASSAALVQDDEVWADGKVWRMLDWRIENQSGTPVQRLDLRSNNKRVLVWTWYGVDQYQSAGRTTIRLRQAMSRYFGSGTGYVVILSVNCQLADCADGEAALEDFMRTTSPALMPQIAESMLSTTSPEKAL